MKAEIEITHIGDNFIYLDSTIEVEISIDQFSELRSLLQNSSVDMEELDSDMREILQYATDETLDSEEIEIAYVRKVRGNL